MDRVKPLKIETQIDGKQTDPLQVEANPAQDYLTGKGFSFEDSVNSIFDLAPDGEIRYKDTVQTTYKKLNDLGADNFSYHIVDTDISVVIKTNQHMIVASLSVYGFLNIQGGLVFL